MRAYIVNLRRRPDRRQRMERLLPAGFDAVFTSDWSGPYDGADLDLEDLGPHRVHPGWEMPTKTGHRYWDRPLRAGEVGCSLSHAACWAHALESETTRPTLFLEDDVEFADGFTERLEALVQAAVSLDPNWGLLYLGRSGHGEDETVGHGLARPGFSYGSFGYLLSPLGLEALAAARLGSGVVPVDEFLPAMYSDHPRPDVRLMYPKVIAAFAAKPPLVTHLPDGTSDSETA